MTQSKAHKHYRFRYDGAILQVCLLAEKRADGALLLGNLGQHHPDEVNPYLDRMRTENIGTVASEAYEVVEEQDEAS